MKKNTITDASRRDFLKVAGLSAGMLVFESWLKEPLGLA